jgi:hypothetical protein
MKKVFLSVAIVSLLLAFFAVTGCSDAESQTDESQIIEISFDSTLANVNHGEKVLFPPEPPFIDYGDVILITGYVYPEGTWASDPNCVDPATGSMCGANMGGGPTFPNQQIGEIVCTGNFFTNPFQFFPPGMPPVLGEEVGIFFLNIKFGEDNSNMLELRGRTVTGFDGSNPAQFSVLGGTGIFKNAKGEALEIMIRPNNSGAFNFEIDLSGVQDVNVGQLEELISGD